MLTSDLNSGAPGPGLAALRLGYPAACASGFANETSRRGGDPAPRRITTSATMSASAACAPTITPATAAVQGRWRAISGTSKDVAGNHEPGHPGDQQQQHGKLRRPDPSAGPVSAVGDRSKRS